MTKKEPGSTCSRS